jgi:transposase
MDQLRWQRLKPFEGIAMLLKRPDGMVNYCRTKIRFGVVEAVNGNIRTLSTAAGATRTCGTCC